ncbi:MAG: BPSS1780 family membrane protein [Gallionellaceae bacterium]
MEAVKVPAIHGWLWIKQGYGLFKKNPLLWMVLTAIGVIGLFAVASIPVIGDPLSTLLFPVVLAGFMHACRALDQNEELELSHLFAGFRQNTQHLITLGGINLVGQLLILGLMMLTGGAAMVSIIMSNEPVTDPAVLMQAMTGAGPALLIGLVLFCILVMAMQFAPMLVIFDNMKPIAALKASLRGFLRNLLPLTVYGLLLLPFAIVASLPVMLGWLFLLPVIITSLYAIYSDLFPMQTVAPKTVAGEVISSDEESHS